MKLGGIPTLMRKFIREIRAFGLLSAVRKTVKGVASRSGLASVEQVDRLVSTVHAMGDEVASLRQEEARLRQQLAVQSEAIGWLAGNHWTTGPLNPPQAAPIVAPLVSVILPVWNREQLVAEAINSVQQQVYTNWELIIVDDGSTDQSAEKIAEFLADKRIQYLRIPHRGVSAARNVGLANSRGDLIAYLDSDDLWYSAFLARMVEAFDAAPERDWAYAAKLFSDESDGTQRILHMRADRTSLLNGNVIPMTAMMHRRCLYELVGGFDEGLERLVDWDLVLRFMAHSEPLVVPVLGGQSRLGSWPRISNQESVSLAQFRVRRKHATRNHISLRILYAVENFPQLSETYVTTEIAAMREQGVDVVVWAEHEAPVPYQTDVPILHGELNEAIAQVNPHMLHVHILHNALRYAPVAQAAGLSMTVRAHGFEVSEELLRAVTQASAVRAVFQFPHFMGHAFQSVDATKLRAMTCCFDPNLYFPRGTPDHRLVVRTAVASPKKHLDGFIRMAAMCPRHRFVLVPCWSVGYPEHLDELHELNRSLGEPVEILVNRPHAEVAELVQRAGIYLHTHTLQDPYGMPVSIAESMAAGCYIIARRTPASAAFVADAGKTYDTEAEAAALVLETETWTSDQWAAVRLASIERAFAHYGSPQVLRPLLDEWTSTSSGSFAATA
jgi:glycosyltransferase involved in cell wall biosynthesis